MGSAFCRTRWHSLLLGATVLPFLVNAAWGQTTVSSGDDQKKLEQVDVYGSRLRDDTAAKLQHIMPEIAGTKITVTKKTTVTKLENLPTIINNNQQQAFAQSPGILVTQQQTPTQFNFSYRGLGNPQESEFVLVLQDGIPINTDWIGFPTLYYVPLIQGVSEIQEIRGGSSLLYGPEPAPVINFVSTRPPPGGPLSGYTEQVGGSDGLYSTYNVLQGSHGKFDFRADFGYVKSDGQRENAQSEVREEDVTLDYRPDEHQIWSLDLHAYDADSGDPGRIGYAQFRSDPSYAPAPYNHDWVQRYSAMLTHRRDFGAGWEFVGKLWSTYQDLDSRSAGAQAAGAPAPSTTTIQDELFRSEGADLRLRKRWGRGNAFTIGTELYRDSAPFRQWTNTDIATPRDEHSGIPRLTQKRSSAYQSIFAEAVFRLPYRFHVVPSVRLERENVTVDETVRPPFLTRPLINVDEGRFVPLFGLGIGNDFGHDNETYFTVSQGWRPLRFFDVASPFANIQPGNVADPSKSLSFEGGVHGTPVDGLFFDVSLFWIDFKNRIETIILSPTDSINRNSGDTRSRGFEGQVSYDFLATQHDGEHLTVFANLSLLDARFTASDIPGQVGKAPAFAPPTLGKFGIIYRRDQKFSISVSGVAVASQYFQDSDMPAGTGATFVPAKVPGYGTIDIAGDIYLTHNMRLLAGISNLLDHKYYSRVFQNGIEPAPGRSLYAGLALGF